MIFCFYQICFFFWFFFQNFVTNFPHTQVNKSFCDYLMQNNNKNRFFQKKKFKEQNNSILKPVPTCKKKNVTSRFYLSILWSELLGGGGYVSLNLISLCIILYKIEKKIKNSITESQLIIFFPNFWWSCFPQTQDFFNLYSSFKIKSKILICHIKWHPDSFQPSFSVFLSFWWYHLLLWITPVCSPIIISDKWLEVVFCFFFLQLFLFQKTVFSS